MGSERSERITELFFQACDLDESSAQRFLDEACADEPELRRDVEALLRHDRSRHTSGLTDIVAAGIVSAAAGVDDGAGAAGPGSAPPAPESIDGYTIVREIGEGGMSVVYEAEQHEPVRRRVALKVIRPGMDTREVVARFESERQALAVMDHPNIARIFDGGAAANGRPYFVMELVDGVPITEFCDARKLDVDTRLKVFLKVCAAVQHAHLKGVVHRDLKPSNILVAEHDRQPTVKVIDFGIAKAVAGSELDESRPVTRLGQTIGTPAYMSPEQAEGRADDIDTRTDVYSLGVVLYQLLTGVLPFRIGPSLARSLREADRDAVPRPSGRFSTLGQERATVAEQRSTDTRALVRTLAANLDWIVLRAMEKSPARRYQTVNALAADIERYLQDLPVAARPPSRAYVVGRFVRRNRKTVVAASLVLAALVAGITMATIGFVRATTAERQARIDALTSGQVVEFLVGLFEMPDPSRQLGMTITAKQILDVGATRILTELDGQPQVQATMMNTMARVYRNLSQYADAQPLFEHALAQRVATLGPDHPDVAETLDELGVLLRLDGDYATAVERHREALAVRKNAFGTTSAPVAESLNNLGLALFAAGSYDEAEALYREGLDIYRALDPPDPDGLSINLNNLAGLLDKRGDFAGAEALFRESLALRRQLYRGNHPQVATLLNNLGVVLAQQGKYDEAGPLYREALVMRRHVLGNDHPQVAITLNNLGLLLRSTGDLDGAADLYRESLDVRRRAFGDEHPAVATGLNNLAGLLLAKGDLDGAEAAYRESLALQEKLEGPRHPNVAIIRTNLAALLVDRGRHDEALREVQIARDVLRDKLPAGHWRLAVADNVMGAGLAGLGQYDDAEALLLASLEPIRTARGDAAVYTQRAIRRLIGLYEAWGKTGQADRFRTELAAVTETD